ncbi:MAG: signal peptidase I [Patescibacteria group bacterium]|nr:signal peptidase I [Patescibacteria group bacterium]
MKNKAVKIYTIAFILWLIAILIFILCIIFGTNGFRADVQSTIFGRSPFFLSIFTVSIALGLIAFLIGVLSLTSFLVSRKKIKNQFLKLLLFIGILFILPIYILVSWFIKGLSLVKSKKIKIDLIKKEYFTKLVTVFFVIIFLLPLWIGGYLAVGALAAYQLGYVAESISIGGTGSMYPTFPKGQGKTLQEQAKEVVGASGMFPYPNGLVLFGQRVLGHQVGRGDIVVLENDTLREYNKKLLDKESGWVKRVVAIGGDTLEIKNGIVYLNNQSLKEPYIAKARSTFGEAFLKECNKITVPENSIFVMGDNRKGSGDSREVGLFNVSDVKYVLPLKDQKGDLVKYWRDTSKDFDEASKIKIDKEKYLELLNSKRKEAGVQLLKYQPKLEISASLRGEIILKYDDFSYEATRSGYTMYKAMADANYSNITYGEAPTQGYFEADELIDNQFQFPKTKEFLLNKDFQEIGISEVEGKINNCPTQVIIQHFAGYVPPNYAKDVIESWEKSLDGLKNIQSGWQDLKHYSQIYDKNKSDVDRINDIISQRISMIEGIVVKMKANQWLSSEQDKYTRTIDKALSDEENSLADKLNSIH